jgi:hypothetical protein
MHNSIFNIISICGYFKEFRQESVQHCTENNDFLLDCGFGGLLRDTQQVSRDKTCQYPAKCKGYYSAYCLQVS